MPQVRHHHRASGCLRSRQIIGDYRRVALYGTARLLEAKHAERSQVDDMWPTDEVIRIREEFAEQMRALQDLAAMAKLYDCDITRPADDAHEAVQWTYLAYLGAVKEANGAAMSVGRILSFLDIYIERDLRERTWTTPVRRILGSTGAEAAYRALPAHARLRCAVQRRPVLGDRVRRRHGFERPAAGDQEQLSHAAHADQSRAGAEPNITVLWSKHLPDKFKRYCLKISRDTSSLQYENDDLMRPSWVTITASHAASRP